MIITNEMLLNAFRELRVNTDGMLYAWSVEELSKRGEYGDYIWYHNSYNTCSDPQSYVDNWMNSTIANKLAEEYFKGEDNMNKYETLLKKYEALYKDFESYREVTEGLATNGYYIKNEALEELLEYKKKYEVLKEEKGLLVDISSVAEENERLKKERDDLVKEVYYLHEVINEKNNKCKEKIDKIKQRDKQITKLIDEKNALHTLYLETAKERDNYKKRLDHINAMSNTDWEFEVVETKPTTSPYDDLVPFCEDRQNSGKGCLECPKVVACDGINPDLRPAKWTENQKEDYNELMSGKEDK